VDIFLIFSKGFGQLTRPADGVGTFDPRASKPSVRRAENGGKIAISGKTVQSAKSGIKVNQWVSILIDLPPAQNWRKCWGNAGFRRPPLTRKKWSGCRNPSSGSAASD
jgi:hypothetical protein